MKECKKTNRHLQKYAADARQSSCNLSSLPFSILFRFHRSLSKMKFYKNFSPQFHAFSRVFEPTFPIDDECVYCAADEHLGARRKNAVCTIGERFSAGGERFESARSNFLPTQLHVQLQYEQFASRIPLKLLLTGTHLQKRAVATVSYTPASMLHPQVIYTIAFSAGLNGVQLD